MHLSPDQQRRFWSDWKAAQLAQGWIKPKRIPSAADLSPAALEAEARLLTPAQIENERYSLLRRAGFESLRDVDHLAGFDRVLAELAALAKPDSVDAQLRQANMPITRLKHAIAKLSPGNNYLRKVMRDKFKTEDWDALSVEQLTQLRNTLQARQSSRKAKAAADSAVDQSDTSAPACRVEAPSEDGSGSDSDLINTSLQGGASDPTPPETVSTVSADPSDNPF